MQRSDLGGILKDPVGLITQIALFWVSCVFLQRNHFYKNQNPNVQFPNVHNFIMSSQQEPQPSDSFYSLDEFHSFVTYKSAAELAELASVPEVAQPTPTPPEHPNDHSVSIIEPSDEGKPEKSICLEKDIDCLKFSDEPDLNALKKSIEELARHQRKLEDRLGEFGEILSQSRASQSQSQVGGCSAEMHRSLQKELKETKQMLQLQQTKIDQLARRNPTQSPPPSPTKTPNPSSPPHPSPPTTTTQRFTLSSNLHYNNQPHFLAFKLCSLSHCPYTLYSNSSITVKYLKTDTGVSVHLQGNQTYKLKVATLHSTHIDLPWSRFAKGKFVENCEIIDSSKQTVVSVPIPLPLNFVFEERLKCYDRSKKYLKLKQMMASCEVNIKYYDRKVWRSLVDRPQLYRFEKCEGRLVHAVNLKGSREMFLVEMEVNEFGLRVGIGHKAGSAGLRDLLEFYSFVMSQ